MGHILFVGGHSCLIFLSNGQKNLDYHFLDDCGKGHWVAANAPYGHSKTTLEILSVKWNYL